MDLGARRSGRVSGVRPSDRRGPGPVGHRGRNVRSTGRCSYNLRITRRRADSCGLHRSTSQVIRRSGSGVKKKIECTRVYDVRAAESPANTRGRSRLSPRRTRAAVSVGARAHTAHSAVTDERPSSNGGVRAFVNHLSLATLGRGSRRAGGRSFGTRTSRSPSARGHGVGKEARADDGVSLPAPRARL